MHIVSLIPLLLSRNSGAGASPTTAPPGLFQPTPLGSSSLASSIFTWDRTDAGLWGWGYGVSGRYSTWVGSHPKLFEPVFRVTKPNVNRTSARSGRELQFVLEDRRQQKKFGRAGQIWAPPQAEVYLDSYFGVDWRNTIRMHNFGISELWDPNHDPNPKPKPAASPTNAALTSDHFSSAKKGKGRKKKRKQRDATTTSEEDSESDSPPPTDGGDGGAGDQTAQKGAERNRPKKLSTDDKTEPTKEQSSAPSEPRRLHYAPLLWSVRPEEFWGEYSKPSSPLWDRF